MTALTAPRAGSLVGTRPLLHATMRHDGRLFAPFVVVATLLSTSSVVVYPWVFPDQASREALAVAHLLRA